MDIIPEIISWNDVWNFCILKGYFKVMERKSWCYNWIKRISLGDPIYMFFQVNMGAPNLLLILQILQILNSFMTSSNWALLVSNDTWQYDREAGLGTAPGVGQTRPPTCSPPPHWPSSGPPQAAYTCTPHLTTELKKIVLYNITVQQLFSWSHCQSIF